VRFDDRFLDEIKSRLRLSDVIGKTVKLRRQGREFVGLSPFNKEKSPSFFVNDDKGFFHDFSSGKHGDLIGFLQETERLSFVEAVERLAAEAGLALPEPDAVSEAKSRERQGLADWVELAAKWFEGELGRPSGKAARDYLAGRGLPAELWPRFRLGFAPASRMALKDYLVAKGALPGDLVAAGLLIAPEDGGAPYDRFRDRIIFPIADGRGRTISFGGRAMDAAARAKYLNGPDSDLFDKGRVLYGLAEARKLLHANSTSGGDGAALVVVEGYMDVIACQRAGVAAVAAMGTSLTEQQMEALWRLHPEPTICLDGDAAGVRAASRAIDRALPHLAAGRSFCFAVLTGGKDPDDILRDQGAAELKRQLGVTTPFVEALFNRERDATPLETPEQRAGLKQRLRAAAKTIADPDLAAAYRDALLSRLDGLFARPPAAAPTASGQRQPWRRGGPPPLLPAGSLAKAAAKRLPRQLDSIPAALARYALADPHVVDDHLEDVERIGFGDPTLLGLATEIIRHRLSRDVLDTESLQRHLAHCGFSELLTDIDRAATHAGAPFIKSDVTLAVARSQWSRAFGAFNQLAALENALRAAKLDLEASGRSPALSALKTERDALRRAIETGAIWTEPPT
jgi:DNA primase